MTTLNKRITVYALALSLAYIAVFVIPFNALAKTSSNDGLAEYYWDKTGELSPSAVAQFLAIYESEFPNAKRCEPEVLEQQINELRLCSERMRNSGSGPFIFTPKNSVLLSSETSSEIQTVGPKGLVVLFHGLSDSPFFMRSIARSLEKKGFVVIVPLTPGHAKKDADSDMQDPLLKARWMSHVDKVMSFADGFGLPLFVGGFSTGGAFATRYSIHHPDKVKGLLLFSGALALSSSAETMSKIWGMKTLAKWLDGEYETDGAHPYKYPSVASFSGLMLMDVIKDIRQKLAESDEEIEVSLFSAHSLADKVTPFDGVEDLSNQLKGEHSLFKIDEEFKLCHADLPMSSVQIVGLSFDKSKLKDTREECKIPRANPLHPQMLSMMHQFIQGRLDVPAN